MKYKKMQKSLLLMLPEPPLIAALLPYPPKGVDHNINHQKLDHRLLNEENKINVE